MGWPGRAQRLICRTEAGRVKQAQGACDAHISEDSWNHHHDRDRPRQEHVYRRSTVAPASNRALSACARFEGDALLVESEHDDIVPAAVLVNYRAAFGRARSLTFRMLAGADHVLSDQASQDAYTAVLTKWLS